MDTDESKAAVARAVVAAVLVLTGAAILVAVGVAIGGPAGWSIVGGVLVVAGVVCGWNG